MRLNAGQGMSAAELVRRMPERELADLIFKFGEEPASRRIARRIVRVREKWNPVTAKKLAELVRSVYPPHRRFSFPHPATRVFQALRIYVNKELDRLSRTLFHSMQRLAVGGRLVVISFHSLEDRIVKHFFREHGMRGEDASAPKLNILTKKPIRAGDGERGENPSSRSALLRIAEKIA